MRKTTLSTLLALLASLAAAPMASAATVTNTSGTACKNYNASDATLVDYGPDGTTSRSPFAMSVICPLTRSSQVATGGTSNGGVVYVDLRHESYQTTTCTGYSITHTGVYLATFTQSWSGIGFVELSLDLRGPGKSTGFSDYSVICTIPGRYQGKILGVDLRENY